jgi:hypothetical protein
VPGGDGGVLPGLGRGASDISETSVLVSRTVQELHFPCLHFEVKAAAKNGKARRV